MEEFFSKDGKNKLRIVEESVPGKQITLAHIVANPTARLVKRLRLSGELPEDGKNAVGIVNVTPGETAIILGDIATKASGVDLSCVDRISGTLIINGFVSEVETALDALIRYSKERLGFTVCDISKT